MEEIKTKLHFNSCFSVDSIGRSGGLALLWKQPFDCKLINFFSSNFINVRVCQLDKPIWRIIGFYGHLDRENREDSWNLLRFLAEDTSLPWFTIGDFNDLLNNDEKIGLVDLDY